MTNSGLSAADVMALTKDNDFFGDGIWGIIMLLIIAGIFTGGWGGFGSAAASGALTRAEMDSEFNQRDIFNTNTNVLENRYANATAEAQTQRDVLENRYTTQLGVQSILSNQSTCCCENKLLTEESKYELSQLADRNNFNTLLGNKDLTAAVAADGDKTRALITAQYEASLLEKINDLKAQVSNAEQTTTILNTMGRWHGYLPCGCNTACSASTSLI